MAPRGTGKIHGSKKRKTEDSPDFQETLSSKQKTEHASKRRKSKHKSKGQHDRAQREPRIDKTSASPDAISQRNQRESPFLRLPGELRNSIYYLALGGHEIYLIDPYARPHPRSQIARDILLEGMQSKSCITAWVGRPKGRGPWDLKRIAQLLALNLRLVCRQIKFEVNPDFVFSHNAFGMMYGSETFTIGGLGKQQLSRDASRKTTLTIYTHTSDRACSWRSLPMDNLDEFLLRARSVVDRLLRYFKHLSYKDEIDIIKRYRWYRRHEYEIEVIYVTPTMELRRATMKRPALRKYWYEEERVYVKT